MNDRLLTIRLSLLLALGGCAPGGSAELPGPDAAHVERMASEHERDRPVASAAVREPEREVVAEEVVYANVGGRAIRGYLAQPAEGPDARPGVVVVHEWWGLNENIRTMTRRLAGEGYLALAVDLLGETADRPERARELIMAVAEAPDEAVANLRQAVAFLRERGAPRLGTIGWCFGGAWSLRAALAAPDDVDAAVVYYGQLESDPRRLSDLNAPVLGLFGEEDRAPSVEEVRAFEGAMREAGKPTEIHIYPGAGHGFANPSGQNFREAAAEDAWARTLHFFARHLTGG